MYMSSKSYLYFGYELGEIKWLHAAHAVVGLVLCTLLVGCDRIFTVTCDALQNLELPLLN